MQCRRGVRVGDDVGNGSTGGSAKNALIGGSPAPVQGGIKGFTGYGVGQAPGVFTDATRLIPRRAHQAGSDAESVSGWAFFAWIRAKALARLGFLFSGLYFFLNAVRPTRELLKSMEQSST